MKKRRGFTFNVKLPCSPHVVEVGSAEDAEPVEDTSMEVELLSFVLLELKLLEVKPLKVIPEIEDVGRNVRLTDDDTVVAVVIFEEGGKVELLKTAPESENDETNAELTEERRVVAVMFLKEVDAVSEELVVEDGIPLHTPWTQVLNAHSSSQVQGAWKLPQTGINIALTA
jgi:hypothetical protein